jgi:nitroreductase
VIAALDGEPDLARVIEAGRLAPSTYNTQPWRFLWLRSPELVERLGGDADGERWLLLVEDETRRIPVADPAAAETALSLGACLANMLLAGRCAGWQPTVVPVEEASAALAERGVFGGRERAAALVRWRVGGGNGAGPPSGHGSRLRIYLDGERGEPPEAAGGLHARLGGAESASLIAARRSERSPYTGRPVDAEVLGRAWAAAAELLGFVPDQDIALYVTTAPGSLARARDILYRTTHRSLRKLDLAREAASWFRHSRASANRTGDGEPLDAAGFGGAELWLARRALNEVWGPRLMRLGGARRIARRNSAGVTTSALLMLWACRAGGVSPWQADEPAACFLAAGCAVEGAWLSLSADGVGVQFMTPCLLFEESRRELAELFELEPGDVPLTLQRAGYPEAKSDELPIRRPIQELVRVV